MGSRVVVVVVVVVVGKRGFASSCFWSLHKLLSNKNSRPLKASPLQPYRLKVVRAVSILCLTPILRPSFDFTAIILFVSWANLVIIIRDMGISVTTSWLSPS